MSEKEAVRKNAYPQGDTVLSSRVRLARNIDGVPFPVRLNVTRRAAVNRKVCETLQKAGKSMRVVDMSRLYPYEAVSLAERHLISPEFTSGTEGRLLLLTEDERISIMLNEEDHIRIQAIEPGLAPEEAYRNACDYDDALDAGIRYAFDNRLGYLNQNPRDLGTGMRVSVMMHLPALSKTGGMTKLASMIGKLGMNVRGSYGDAASVKGDIFRVGNQVSMGITEAEAIANLKTLTMQLATKEHAAAAEFVKDIGVRDRITRAEGVLKNAMLLTADEMMEMLSWVRLGALYGLNDADPDVISEMFTSLQPATVNVMAGAKLTAAQRDELRAGYVRKKLVPDD